MNEEERNVRLDLLRALKPMRCLCVAVGLSPYSGATLRRRPVNTAYSTFVALLTCVMFCGKIWRLSLTTPASVVSAAVALFGNCLCSAMVLAALLRDAVPAGARRYRRVLLYLGDVDARLRLNGAAEYRRVRCRATLQVLALLAAILCVYGYWLAVGRAGWIYILCTSVDNVVIYTAEMRFVGLLHLLRRRFRQINVILDSADRVDLQNVRVAYDMLCEVASDVMSAHQPFLSMLLLFLLFTFPWALFCVVTAGSSEFGNVLRDDGSYGLLLAISSVQLVTLAWSGHEASAEASATRPLVWRRRVLRRRLHDDDLQLRLLDLQLSVRRVAFDVAGVASLNGHLIANYVSTITTCLVVLVELH